MLGVPAVLHPERPTRSTPSTSSHPCCAASRPGWGPGSGLVVAGGAELGTSSTSTSPGSEGSERGPQTNPNGNQPDPAWRCGAGSGAVPKPLPLVTPQAFNVVFEEQKTHPADEVKQRDQPDRRDHLHRCLRDTPAGSLRERDKLHLPQHRWHFR